MSFDFLKEAEAIERELIANRRHIHAHAETGFDVAGTVAFVKEKLEEYGLQPKSVTDKGVVATIGKGEPVILFRADMDALPGEELANVDFRSEKNMHMCGHDMHTTMLLGVAKLLKRHESELKGTVKLVFQPAEEILKGALSLSLIHI